MIPCSCNNTFEQGRIPTTIQDKFIKGKLNLLELGTYLCNVSKACRTPSRLLLENLPR